MRGDASCSSVSLFMFLHGVVVHSLSLILFVCMLAPTSHTATTNPPRSAGGRLLHPSVVWCAVRRAAERRRAPVLRHTSTATARARHHPHQLSDCACACAPARTHTHTHTSARCSFAHCVRHLLLLCFRYVDGTTGCALHGFLSWLFVLGLNHNNNSSSGSSTSGDESSIDAHAVSVLAAAGTARALAHLLTAALWLAYLAWSGVYKATWAGWDMMACEEWCAPLCCAVCCRRGALGCGSVVVLVRDVLAFALLVTLIVARAVHVVCTCCRASYISSCWPSGLLLWSEWCGADVLLLLAACYVPASTSYDVVSGVAVQMV